MSKENSIFSKLGNFFLEIIIIVFSISLSFWIQNMNDYRSRQADVKEFMKGLKQDLLSDVKEMEADKESYLLQKKAFQFITRTKVKDTSLDLDSIKVYGVHIFNRVGLNPNDGRFEGFKSSGKIGDIENKELQNLILDLYQENIVQLITSTNNYNRFKDQLEVYIMKNRKKITDSTTNFANLMVNDEAQNISRRLIFTEEIVARYDSCINKARNIIELIHKEYSTESEN